MIQIKRIFTVYHETENLLVVVYMKGARIATISTADGNLLLRKIRQDGTISPYLLFEGYPRVLRNLYVRENQVLSLPFTSAKNWTPYVRSDRAYLWFHQTSPYVLQRLAMGKWNQVCTGLWLPYYGD